MAVAKKSGSNLTTRIIAAAVMVPVALFIAFRGGWLFNGVIAVLGGIMALEWTNMVHKGRLRQQFLHVLAVIIAISSVYTGQIAWPSAVIMAMTIVSLAIRKDETGLLWPLLGLPYIAFSIMALVWLRQTALPLVRDIPQSTPDFGLIAVLMLFAAVWAADSLAYFAGRTIGGPKLWPSVSPNKTWAGFFGAIAGGMLGVSLVAWIAFADKADFVAVMLTGAAIGGIEQGGDLLISAAKRKFGIKDTGTIIPGHGGILDRVDGLMAASLFIWINGMMKFGPAMAGWILLTR